MSLIIGYAAPEVAVVFADQRWTDPEAHKFQDTGRKVLPIPNGFVSLTGSTVLIAPAMAHIFDRQPADAVALRAAVAAVVPEMAGRLRAMFPEAEAVPLVCNGAAVFWPAGGAATVHRLSKDGSGEDAPGSRHRIFQSWPCDPPPAGAEEARRAMMAALGDAGSLAQLLRAFLSFYAAAAAASPLVGPSVEAGIIFGGHRFWLNGPTAGLLRCSDDELEHFLTDHEWTSGRRRPDYVFPQ